MNIDWIKKFWTKKNAYMLVALVLGVMCYQYMNNRVMPMAMGDSGANPSDVGGALLTGALSLLTMIIGQYCGVKPELIQAAIAYEKDRSDKDNLRRLGSAVIGYLVGIIGAHPDGVETYLLYFLNSVSMTLKDTNPSVATALTKATTEITATLTKAVENKNA